MRLSLLSLVLISSTATNAQLINGSFENGTDGWNVPCECAPAMYSPDGAPGGGGQCIGLENVHLDCGCMLFSAMEQFTPWLTPGPWRLSGWIKSAVPGDEPGSRIAITDGPVFSSGVIANIWSYAGSWEFKEATFNLNGSEDVENMRISLVPDDGNQQPAALCYFDNIQLTFMLSTGVADPALKTLAFRPNPATDKLWVDLAESPSSIVCTDATGRELPLQTFRNTGRTVEVDVSSVPPGLSVIVLKTASGTRTVRFIKV